MPHCALETTGIEFEQGAMHNWLTTPLEYIIRDYIGFMSEKEHAQTNYRSNKQPPLLSNSISLFEFEAVIELEFKDQVFREGHTNFTNTGQSN